MNWYMEVLRKFAQFDGRARRKEYWMFALFNTLIYCALILVGVVIGTMIARGSDNPATAAIFMVPAWLYIVAMIVPSLAVGVRRLHDTGRSGWWLLIGFVPFVGA